MVRGISIVPAPFWMRSRIAKAGMRPINAIVDVTNYVMLELGQPLHAFDYAAIADRAHRGERGRGADASSARSTARTGRSRRATSSSATAPAPSPLAGVMGGENSEIGPTTTDVALESAFFNPLLIRRTARRLDLRSEASARFEKGIDIENVDFAARRAIELMQRTAGGDVLAGSMEVYEKRAPRTIAVEPEAHPRIIGTPLTRQQIVGSLASIGIRQTVSDGRDHSPSPSPPSATT